MKEYDFDVICNSCYFLSADEVCEIADRLAEAVGGLPDFLISFHGYTATISFDREAENLEEALNSAFKLINENSNLDINSVKLPSSYD